MAVHSTYQPNTAARRAVTAGHATWSKTLAVAASRLVLFAAFQALIALLFWAGGKIDPWQSSVAFWPWSFTLANFASIVLLTRLLRSDGLRLADLYRSGDHKIWRELLLVIAVFVLAGPIAWLPNTGLAALLFGDSMTATRMMFLPLPDWALYPVMLLFPVSVALAELPTYFGYVMPRLEALSGKTWAAVGLAAFALAAQHIAAPLIFDGRYLLWRLLMFLPFALYVGIVIRLRPGLLPYLMIGHGIIDFGTIMTVWMASRGML